MKAIVIGGRISGLTAVQRLNKAGVDAVFIEQDNVTGGKIVYTCHDDDGIEMLHDLPNTVFSAA
jgi:protoporphyrinogen oxidase